MRNTPVKDRRGPTKDERLEAQSNFPAIKRVGNKPRAYESREAAQRTPPHTGRQVYEEEVRRTPAKDRRGPTRDERTEAQNNFHASQRVGNNPQAYAKPGTSRETDARKPKKKKRSRGDRDAEDRSRRKSLARDAKKLVVYRDNSGDRLEGQIKDDSGTYTFPKGSHETTSESDSNPESESEEEIELHQRRRN